jgi:hypothetical protein
MTGVRSSGKVSEPNNSALAARQRPPPARVQQAARVATRLRGAQRFAEKPPLVEFCGGRFCELEACSPVLG